MTGNTKPNRSSVYHLINTIKPINHRLKARFDAWGSVLIIGLSLGGVSLMRLLLCWTQ